MDFDPRDYDSRDDERQPNAPQRGGRSGASDHDRDHDWSQPETRARDRDYDPRWADRDRDDRERHREVPDTFSRHFHLPRGHDRERVHDRDREYTLRGSESRALPTVGAFRVVSRGGYGDQYTYPEPDGVDTRVAEEAAGYESDGLLGRLLTAFEVAEFVGCHEETVRRAYLRGKSICTRTTCGTFSGIAA